MIKKILLALLMILILIQFYRPKRNISAQPMPNDVSQVYAVPADVHTIINKACADCHSNNTRYPWYAEIQPVRWWLDDHIEEGKKELNFNEFKTYSPRRQYNKLQQTVKQIKEGEMPLSSYTLIHANARLTDTEKQTLFSWANAICDTMKATYPADSLARRKNPPPAK